MSFNLIHIFTPINSLLATNSINVFGILWAGFIWMLAGLVAGILAAIPVGFLIVSLSDDYNPGPAALKASLFVVSVMTLAGLVIGGLQELNKQSQPISFQPQISIVLPRNL